MQINILRFRFYSPFFVIYFALLSLSFHLVSYIPTEPEKQRPEVSIIDGFV